jgi:hypothetical protein
MFNAQLARQVETWKKYWENVTCPDEAERRLQRLRWLEEFAFHCGPEISLDQYRALEHEIGVGESRLSELRGDVPEIPLLVSSQPSDYTSSEAVKNGGPET